MSKRKFEEEVFQGFLLGREDCFEKIFRSMYPALIFFARKMIYDEDVAKDIVQDVFIKVWNKRERITNFPALRSYVYQAVRNQSLDVIRKNTREQIRYRKILLTADVSERSIMEYIVTAETYRQVDLALKKLPKSCQHIMNMLFKEEMSIEEVANKLKVSKSTVSSQKQRGLKLLRKSMSPLMLIMLYFFNNN